MKKRKSKNLKYRDLAWELKDCVDFAYGHIQRAQNPTVRHIIKSLLRREKMYEAEGAYVSAKEKRDARLKLESLLSEKQKGAL